MDVGSGTELVGVDLDTRAAIGFAAAFAPHLDFRVAAVDSLDQEFDVVTCVETLEHIPDDDASRFLSAVSGRVRPGGILVVTVPTTARPLTAKHFRHYDIASLRRALTLACPQMIEIEMLEIVPHRPWLDRSLPFLNNRHFGLDVCGLNYTVAGLHRRPVSEKRRGLHVLTVLQRPGDD